ncbi:hypothetical protein OIV83_000787 [Microbotryomycetes sp. JL201]|nr:hypothetical protein OIV83_000787 [Microbotryomycetes sp. JL201]
MPSFILLYTTLGAGTLSLACSMYTALRTLLPLLGTSHPLSKRHGVAVGDFPRPPAPPPDLRLKSAQRFSTYLSIGDITAISVLVWDAGVAVSTSGQLGTSRGGGARLTFICLARTTLMFAVAMTSYINVARGTSIRLGRADWVLWLPCSLALASGTALAVIAHDPSRVSIGIVAWLALSNFATVLCFGRLLVAVVRVRHVTRQQELLPWSHKAGLGKSKRSRWSAVTSFLPPIHATFSGLSSTFVKTIGLSKSSTTTSRSHTSRSSQASSSFDLPRGMSNDQQRDHRSQMRSATPHSATGLLANYLHPSLSRSTGSDSVLTGRQEFSSFGADDNGSNGHEVLDFEVISRRSFGSVSSASIFVNGQVGSVGSRGSREEALREVWGRSPAPGTGHSTISVELSSSEARGAILRLGGHLLSSVLGCALLLPFHVHRVRQTPLDTASSILLVIGVSQHSLILMVQCWASDGFWLGSVKPLKPTTSSSSSSLSTRPASPEEMIQTRPASALSTYYAFSKSNLTLPGIDPRGADCAPEPKSSVGRALSMLQTHPKLVVLSGSTEPLRASTSATETRAHSHLRLRSLNLPKTVDATISNHNMSKSLDSPALVAAAPGEHGRASPLLKTVGDDEAIARALLNRKRHEKRSEQLQLREAPSKPTDVSIDHLSANVLPRLVPSVTIGASTVVRPPPATRRPPGSLTIHQITSPFGHPPDRPARNIRNLSLPILSVTRASVKSSASSSEQSLESPLKSVRGSFESSCRLQNLEQASESSDSIETETDEQDVNTGTIQCATVKPISRNSLSSEFESVSSPRMFRQPQEQARKRESNASSGSLVHLSGTSMTAAGFKNALETGYWHAPGRLPLEVIRGPPVEENCRTGPLRPLKLLTQANEASQPSHIVKEPFVGQSFDENLSVGGLAKTDPALPTSTPEQVTSRTRVRKQKALRPFAALQTLEHADRSNLRGMR